MPAPADWVVDASVAVKWLVPEDGSDAAAPILRAAREGRIRVHVPAIWLSEVASSLLKKTRRPPPDRIDVPIAARMLDSFRSLGVRVHAHETIVMGAFGLAARSGLSLYDALYAALAVAGGFRLVTADCRLLDEAPRLGLGGRIVGLSDWAA
jgi:predicted nucleic acid-binding protein